MTIAEAIRRLEELARKYSPNGNAIQVYFDCPNCGQSYTPDIVEPVLETRIRIKGK